MLWHRAEGRELSEMVTMAEHEELFPLLSVTVRLTVFGPRSAVVKLLTSRLNEAIPQLSEDPPSTKEGSMEIAPSTKETAMSWQMAIGSTLSSTVTVAEQVEAFPLTSVTVSVTAFAPTSEQSKSETSRPKEAIPQLSEEPLSISSAATEALPIASSCRIMSWQMAIGSILSSTVTLVEQVEAFPLTSVT